MTLNPPCGRNLDYFVATTDTFAGNSGSGVYELSGYTVAGILVRGETDYVSNGSCQVVNVCSETGCRGEDITYVRSAIDAYCAVAGSTRLCGRTEPPPPPPNTFSYSATNTNYATQNTVNKVLSLTVGQMLTVGTCGLANASGSGDTFLRLFGPGGTEVASNDDACGGRTSNFSYTVHTSGDYEIRAGCYSTGSCSGTVAWEITDGSSPPPNTSSFTYSASNTNSAQRNTTDRNVTVSAGQRITLGTCGLTGATFSGDTYLRLFGPSGTQVAANDDSCSGSGSNLGYLVPSNAGGTYQIRAGCYSNKSCSGTVVYTVQ